MGKWEKGVHEHWMLYAEGSAAPTHKHETLESARAEAERIVQIRNVVRVFILKACEVVERDVPPIVRRELVPMPEADGFFYKDDNGLRTED